MPSFERKFGPQHRRAFIAAVLDGSLGEKCSTRRAIRLAAEGGIPGWEPALTIGQGTAYDWIEAEKERRAGLDAGKRARKDVGQSVTHMTQRLAVLHEAELRDLEHEAKQTGNLDHSRARELLRNLKLIDDLRRTEPTKPTGSEPGNGDTPASTSTLGKAAAAMAAEPSDDIGPSDPTPLEAESTKEAEDATHLGDAHDASQHEEQARENTNEVRSGVPAGGPGDVGQLSGLDAGLLRLERPVSGALAGPV